ncbi:MAG: DUF6017 domain-containing protein [Oscillospiraceae bacterium]|nr:DUF6017 domain-containing protein [Oscillospiraceae bacterium]
MNEMEHLDLPYFYGNEADQYTFFRMPKVLFTERCFDDLSVTAKVLYSLMLDRMTLSMRNGWFDEDGKAFIYYTLKYIQRDLRCANQKATKLLVELEAKGLIERKNPGQGKPTKIYVKKFDGVLRKSEIKNHENHDSGFMEIMIPESRKSNSNNTDKNNTDFSDIESIIHSDESGNRVERIDEYSSYREYFLSQLDFDSLLAEYPYDQEQLNEILDLLVETVCSRRKTIRISGDDKPSEIVKSQLLKLDSEHIRFVMSCLKENTTRMLYMSVWIIQSRFASNVMMYISSGWIVSEVMKMKDKAIALYLRLSMSDGDLGKDNKDESNSIENQRELLLSYIDGKDDFLCGTREYIDDGYTGTNFNRPGFQRMMKDAQSGEIDCILVKDLSRLGRDYIGVGDYIEQIFPMLGIRFIAVNNNFDSSNYLGTTAGLDFAVSNLINSLYSRDVSKKVRSSLETKWKQGCATSSVVPFGYTWDSSSKQRWVIDPVASKYVRKVFDLALEGKNTKQIAAEMNRAQIPTPGLYAKMTKKTLGKSVYMAPESEMLWKPPIVSGMLRKYEYTGALVMGKYRKIALGSSTHRTVPMEDRTIAENAHEAIVTHEEFYNAQRAVRTISPMSYKTPCEYPLKGIVRCGNCNRLLSYSIRHGEGSFVCSTKRSVGSFSKCYSDFYRESTINTAVAYAIQNVIESALFLQDKIQKKESKSTVQIGLPESEEKLLSDLDILKAEKMRQYEVYADGVIDKTAYLKKKQELSEKIEALEGKIQEIREWFRVENEPMDCVQKVTKEARERPRINGLSRELVESFVEAVYLNGDSMKIVFKSEDLFQKALEKYMLDSGMTKGEDGKWLYPSLDEE